LFSTAELSKFTEVLVYSSKLIDESIYDSGALID